MINETQPLAFGIAVLYSMFAHRLINHASGYVQAKDMCSDSYIPPSGSRGSWNMSENDDRSDCYKRQALKLKEVEFRRHWMLNAVAVAGFAVSMSMGSNQSAKLGIGLGSVLTLLTAVFLNWSTYLEWHKMVITGGCLAAALFVSYDVASATRG
jgi:hypothetical protein